MLSSILYSTAMPNVAQFCLIISIPKSYLHFEHSANGNGRHSWPTLEGVHPRRREMVLMPDTGGCEGTQPSQKTGGGRG
jgi:hypothetical protein